MKLTRYALIQALYAAVAHYEESDSTLMRECVLRDAWTKAIQALTTRGETLEIVEEDE